MPSDSAPFDTPGAAAPPERIVVHAASGRLGLQWPDEAERLLPVRTLRQSCRCAQCESLRRKGGAVAADAPADLAIVGIEPQGSTGVQLRFSDGHERGIYPWHWLRTIASG